MLHPNLEGLLRAIAECAPGRWPEHIRDALNKDRIARDLVLGQAAAEAMTVLRACIQRKQPGLAALATAVAELVPGDAIA